MHDDLTRLSIVCLVVYMFGLNGCAYLIGMVFLEVHKVHVFYERSPFNMFL